VRIVPVFAAAIVTFAIARQMLRFRRYGTSRPSRNVTRLLVSSLLFNNPP